MMIWFVSVPVVRRPNHSTGTLPFPCFIPSKSSPTKNQVQTSFKPLIYGALKVYNDLNFNIPVFLSYQEKVSTSRFCLKEPSLLSVAALKTRWKSKKQKRWLRQTGCLAYTNHPTGKLQPGQKIVQYGLKRP